MRGTDGRSLSPSDTRSEATRRGAGVDARATPPAPPNRLLELLRAWSPAEHERVSRHLETLDFTTGDILFESRRPIAHAWFPEGCVSSTVKLLAGGTRIEVGAAGVEGMVGMHGFLHADSAPLDCLIQIPGQARRLPVAAFREASAPGSALHEILRRYTQYAYNEAAQSVACNRLHAIEQRGARWLLMMHDRAQRDQFPLTHEYLATMLGVWRPAVSQMADGMRTAGLIDYRRGRMRIVDRVGLEAAACECYASDRAEYERLFPSVDREGRTPIRSFPQPTG